MKRQFGIPVHCPRFLDSRAMVLGQFEQSRNTRGDYARGDRVSLGDRFQGSGFARQDEVAGL